MGSNNYITPYVFTQPPPNYNLHNSWGYSWSTSHQTQRSPRNNRAAAPPPPPAYPPPPSPPPPPPPASSTHDPLPPAPTEDTQSLERKPQSYYYIQQSHYRTRRYSNSSNGHYNSNSSDYAVTSGQYVSFSRQYNSSSLGSYITNNSPSYTKNYYLKRKPELDADGSRKGNKKKKKPLSQNIPQRKEWSVYDATRALTIEKDYNKRHKTQSLIIKFPDLQLNRDIVAKFNPAIESVHFQQPSTPRFCFVTLKESVDPETVISELNKTPFGQGFLTAEYKKDRDDEINIGPEDIDPLTLYVGNLAQEITKDDMLNTYPRQKRIDIGYAKKMKYTRYAFVSFKTVNDSIEAFQRTHATQMYSKSLIVRFRRLNGTVGMPGEPKPQFPQRIESGEQHNNESHMHSSSEHNNLNQQTSSDVDTENCNGSTPAPWDMVDVSNWESNLNSVKEEPPGDSDGDSEHEEKPPRRDYVSPFMPGSLDVAFSLHKPIVKTEVKEHEDSSKSNSLGEESYDILHHEEELEHKPVIYNSNDSDCTIITPDKIKKETDEPDDRNSYNSLRLLNKKMRNREFIPVKVKRETSTPTLDELSTDGEERLSSRDTEQSVQIKSEPEDKGDETSDDDEDDSSDSDDSSDDTDFNNFVSNIEDRKKRKIKKSIS